MACANVYAQTEKLDVVKAQGYFACRAGGCGFDSHLADTGQLNG
jgi:hypothetical protein